MDEIIVLRYGEIYLKGKNRSFFENRLIKNIKDKLKGIPCRLNFYRSRYEVCEFSTSDKNKIVNLLKTVFGLHSLSVAFKTATDIESITNAAKKFIKEGKTFKIKAHRGDKTYPMTSVEIGREVGARILQSLNCEVDLNYPEIVINVDVRESGAAYVYGEVIKCAGGMPVGTAGRGLLLLSGGIDSPVAGYMMLKRGLELTALHFHSYPYTSELAKQKVITLAKKLTAYGGKINLITVSTTAIQEKIHQNCNDSYMITLLRRTMMKIALQIANEYNAGCIVNGESLAQVASQTLQGITVSNEAVGGFPVFRPLIGMDKEEIIEISKKIDTYDTSILPYEDCCTVFLPDSPATKPTIDRAKGEETKIEDLDELIAKAISEREIITIEP